MAQQVYAKEPNDLGPHDEWRQLIFVLLFGDMNACFYYLCYYFCIK